MPAALTAVPRNEDADMAERVPFLLRLDPETLAALRRWAADDMRSLNSQIEFVLRRALRDAGRRPGAERDATNQLPSPEDEAAP
jgi:hypothetical protein